MQAIAYCGWLMFSEGSPRPELSDVTVLSAPLHPTSTVRDSEFFC